VSGHDDYDGDGGDDVFFAVTSSDIWSTLGSKDVLVF
jgi:hypothetical protein